MHAVRAILSAGLVVTAISSQVFAWIDYPANGFATMTHYDLPRDDVAACGCTSTSTHYPTAALSQMAYGSSNAYGAFCINILSSYISPTYHDHRSGLRQVFQLDIAQYLLVRSSVVSDLGTICDY